MSVARAAVFRGAGQPFELREFPLPEPQGREVLVEVVACTMCGSDLHSIHGRRAVPIPSILGHEILGRIAAFGPAAPKTDAAGRPLNIGDRVTWAIVANCGECFYCRHDLPQKCEKQTKYGHEPLRPGQELTGGLASHCLLAPGTAVFRVPDNLFDEVVSPANCATATIGGALEAAGDLAGRDVLIMGAGMLGVTATACARTAGARSVIVCDTSPERVEAAKVFGATHSCLPGQAAQCVAERTSKYGVDAALELTGSPEAFETLLPLVRLGGRVVLIGSVFPTRPVPMLLEQIVRRCLTIRGLHNYAPRHLEAALSFLAATEYPFDSLVSKWHPLTDLDRLVAADSPPGKLRIGIRPS
jgi:putative phosphonate catabolism associated alcohol dehydrogenase